MSAETLTKFERLSLVNQYRILESLEPENAEHHRLLAEIFEEGYTGEYRRAFESFSEEFTPEETTDVLDTLSMYQALQRGFHEFTEAEREGIDQGALEFRGWDGNEPDDARKAAFAEFLTKAGRWATLRKKCGDDFNSHMPNFEQYDRMLYVWRAAVDRHELTASEVKRILAAYPHPDSPRSPRKSFRAV